MANGYICLKSCNFGGVAYKSGDIVPAENVLPARERSLVALKVIAIASELPQASETATTDIVIPITTKTGSADISVTVDDILTVMKIVQENVENATKDIALIEKEAVLIMIDKLDARKSIKVALESRITTIMPEDQSTDEGAGMDEIEKLNQDHMASTDLPATKDTEAAVNPADETK